MLTARGWSFLVIVLLLLGFGIFARIAGVAILTLTILLWFVAEFVFFVLRSHSLHRRLRVRREVWDERGPVTTLWSGASFRSAWRSGPAAGSTCLTRQWPTAYLSASITSAVWRTARDR